MRCRCQSRPWLGSPRGARGGGGGCRPNAPRAPGPMIGTTPPPSGFWTNCLCKARVFGQALSIQWLRGAHEGAHEFAVDLGADCFHVDSFVEQEGERVLGAVDACGLDSNAGESGSG